MPRPRHSLLIAGLATLLLAAATATAHSSPRAAKAAGAAAHLLSCSRGKLTRPQGTVVLACGDGNIAISHTRWASWTGKSAGGTTDLEINLCTPTCVQSKMRTFTGSTVRLFAVRRTSSGPVFSKAAISYSNAGKRTTVTAYPRT